MIEHDLIFYRPFRALSSLCSQPRAALRLPGAIRSAPFQGAKMVGYMFSELKDRRDGGAF
jgi:hypothetical protein